MAALVAAVILQWIAIAVLAALVFALTRQVGVLYERVAPAGALMIGSGLTVGESAPVVRAARLGSGATEMVGAPREDGLSTLVVFVSPTCPVCKALLPVLRSLGRDEAAKLRLLLAGDGAADEHEAFARREGLEALPFVLSTQLGMTWQVSKLPWAALVDGAGIVRAHGIVNSREHLESLVEAHERGVASIQDWFARGATDWFARGAKDRFASGVAGGDSHHHAAAHGDGDVAEGGKGQVVSFPDGKGSHPSRKAAGA